MDPGKWIQYTPGQYSFWLRAQMQTGVQTQKQFARRWKLLKINNDNATIQCTAKSASQPGSQHRPKLTVVTATQENLAAHEAGSAFNLTHPSQIL